MRLSAGRAPTAVARERAPRIFCRIFAIASSSFFFSRWEP